MLSDVRFVKQTSNLHSNNSSAPLGQLISPALERRAGIRAEMIPCAGNWI
jgi:hypothetical protein